MHELGLKGCCRRLRGGLGALASVGLFAALVPGPAQAAAGNLDPSFGPGGVAAVAPQLFGATLQPDGNLLAAGGLSGSLTVSRVTQGGQSDGSFGSSGTATGRSGTGRAVAVQSDGKIVGAGTGTGMVIERFNSDGTADGSFGGGSGAVALLGGSGGAANAVAIQSDGKIVVAGSVLGGDGTPRVAVARLNSGGSLDQSFGSGGITIIDLSSYSQVYGIVVAPGGKIVIVGSQRPGFQVTNGFIARLTATGSLDPSFGSSRNSNFPCSGGVCFYYHPYGGAGAALNAVTLQTDGKIVAAGFDVRSENAAGEPACANDCPHAIVVRYDSNGALDTGFGVKGVAALPSGANTRTGDATGAFAVAIGGGGDIVAAGDYQNQIASDVALWAFTPSGVPETRFGSGGTVTTVLSNPAHGRALAVASDGSLVVAGQLGSDGFVARYIGLGPPPTGGGGGGQTAAPAATTGPASAVGVRSAQLTGSINPQGRATSYFFVYGPTTAYGSRTPISAAGFGTGAVGVSQSVGALQARTTYHYRLVASSSAGFAAGTDQTFRTQSFKALMSRVSAHQRIKTIVSGLRIAVRCNAACSIHASLLVSRVIARRLGLGKRSLTIASGSGSLRSRGNDRIRLKLVRGVRAAVARQPSLAVSLRIVIATPARHGSLVISERLSCKR